MASLKHLHKYRRNPKSKCYQCKDPNCTHYTQRENLFGKKAICSYQNCTNVIYLDPSDNFRADISEPKCDYHRKGSRSKTRSVADSLIDEITISEIDLQILFGEGKLNSNIEQEENKEE